MSTKSVMFRDVDGALYQMHLCIYGAPIGVWQGARKVVVDQVDLDRIGRVRQMLNKCLVKFEKKLIFGFGLSSAMLSLPKV